MRGEGGGEQRRQRRDRAVHQSGKTRLDILQHEHAPPRLVFFGAHVGSEDFVGQFRRGVLVALFGFREIGEQPAHADILGLFGRLE